MAIITQDEALTYLFPGRNAKFLTKEEVALVRLLQAMADQLVSDWVGYTVSKSTYTEYYPDRMLSRLRDELVDTAPYELIGGRAVQYGALGINNQVIQMRHLPVRGNFSASNVIVFENPAAWDVFPPSWPVNTQLQEGLDFQVDYREIDADGQPVSFNGHIYRKSGAWFGSPVSQRTIKVTYDAGYTDTELGSTMQSFKLASFMTLRKLFNEATAQRTNPITKSIGGAITSDHLDQWSVNFDGQTSAANMGLQYSLPAGAKRILEPYISMQRYL